MGTRNNCSVWKQKWSTTKGQVLTLAQSAELHPGWAQRSASDSALVMGFSGAFTMAITTGLNSWGRMRLACSCAPWREGVHQLLPGMGALGVGWLDSRTRSWVQEICRHADPGHWLLWKGLTVW